MSHSCEFEDFASQLKSDRNNKQIKLKRGHTIKVNTETAIPK